MRSNRFIVKNTKAVAGCFLSWIFLSGQGFSESPVASFWNAYDAREEPLQVEVVQSWEDDLGSYQLVRYHLASLEGSNRSAAPKIAAYYGVPKQAKASSSVPGIVHIHGGGQRANKSRVADWVKLGYACISINWGGKVLEQPATPNTDWDGLAAGFIGDRTETHHNTVEGSVNTLYKEHHLLNSSWSLIAMSARRALTFLEQRPEVDGGKLGVEGHSMGGRSTVLTAIDPRIKAASPSVGGTGFLYQDLWGLPGSARRMSEEAGLTYYKQVVSCQSYWPHIQAPLLFLQAANDFNAPNDLVFEGMALLPEASKAMVAIAPHFNHRFTTDTAAARFMWMEAHLKEDFRFPGLSASALKLDTEDGTPVFTVSVNQTAGLPVELVRVFYGYARDPRIRFWRSAEVQRKEGGVYTARCPVFDINEPLFAFANITYKMPRPLPARPGAAETDLLTVSSQYQSIYPDALKAAMVKADATMYRVIDDFSRGWDDWYRLSENNPHHWFYATRKIIDPAWMGPKGGHLMIDLETTAPGNVLAVGIEANTWQNYTGRKRDTYHAVVPLAETGRRTVSLRAGEFKNKAGEPMVDWDEATELFLTPASKVTGTGTHWNGQPLRLHRVRWQGGEQVRRPHPHQSREAKNPKAGVFEDEFQKAIDDSVKLEERDAKRVQNSDL